jgi:peptide deformylase
MNRRTALKDALLLGGVLAFSGKDVFAETTKSEKRKKIIRKIAELGNESLRVKTNSLKITDIKKNKKLKNIIEDMMVTLEDSGGVGLASTQVFENTALFLFVNDMDKFNVEVAVNPKIIGHSVEKKKGYEGCLSIPGIRAFVPRYIWIDVEYTNLNNKTVKIRYKDFIARIFQHEFDHLNGLLYLDRLESNRDIITEAEYEKLSDSEKKR